MAKSIDRGWAPYVVPEDKKEMRRLSAYLIGEGMGPMRSFTVHVCSGRRYVPNARQRHVAKKRA